MLLRMRRRDKERVVAGDHGLQKFGETAQALITRSVLAHALRLYRHLSEGAGKSRLAIGGGTGNPGAYKQSHPSPLNQGFNPLAAAQAGGIWRCSSGFLYIPGFSR
jgi:hypothetical protein